MADGTRTGDVPRFLCPVRTHGLLDPVAVLSSRRGGLLVDGPLRCGGERRGGAVRDLPGPSPVPRLSPSAHGDCRRYGYRRLVSGAVWHALVRADQFLLQSVRTDTLDRD